MPSTVPAGQLALIEVTLDSPNLFVGFTVFNESGASPVQVTGQLGQVNDIFPALNFFGNSYRAKIPGNDSTWYSVNKAVYTDDTYTVINTEEPQGSETIYFLVYPDVILNNQSVKGIVDDNVGPITGIILEDENAIEPCSSGCR